MFLHIESHYLCIRGKILVVNLTENLIWSEVETFFCVCVIQQNINFMHWMLKPIEFGLFE